MNPDLLEAGAVVRYPYLWLQQHRRGEESGRKSRPVCLVLAVHEPQNDLHHLALLAISSQPPKPDQTAIEIPEMERRRAGLSGSAKAWVYVSEWNYDIAERSFYFEPGQLRLGSFTPRFLAVIARAFKPTMTKRGSRVSRV